jgi:hypothetical protein
MNPATVALLVALLKQIWKWADENGLDDALMAKLAELLKRSMSGEGIPEAEIEKLLRDSGARLNNPEAILGPRPSQPTVPPVEPQPQFPYFKQIGPQEFHDAQQHLQPGDSVWHHDGNNAYFVMMRGVGVVPPDGFRLMFEVTV